MADSGPVRGGFNVDVKPHVYDPFAHPEFFEGVLARRMIAFVIDIVIITVPVVLACMFILMFGFVTFGLGWGLFLLAYPGAVIWALLYYGTTMGGRRRPPSGCARSTSKSAPGTGRPAISCSASCMPWCSGY